MTIITLITNTAITIRKQKTVNNNDNDNNDSNKEDSIVILIKTGTIMIRMIILI